MPRRSWTGMKASVVPHGARGGHRPNRFTRGSVTARLYRLWCKLRRGHPGRRFLDLYDYRHRRRLRRADPSRWFAFGGGLTLVAVGLVIGWLPGPGGFLSIVGLALIATELRPLARLLDRCEVLFRGWTERLRASGPVAKRMLVVAGAVLALAGLAQLASGLFR